jgi:hypothetical protein
MDVKHYSTGLEMENQHAKPKPASSPEGHSLAGFRSHLRREKSIRFVKILRLATTVVVLFFAFAGWSVAFAE